MRTTCRSVRREVERYFKKDWLFLALEAGGWQDLKETYNMYNTTQTDTEFWTIVIRHIEIRIYRLEAKINTNRDINAIRLALWDTRTSKHDDMYIVGTKNFKNIPILLDKFFG